MSRTHNPQGGPHRPCRGSVGEDGSHDNHNDSQSRSQYHRELGEPDSLAAYRSITCVARVVQRRRASDVTRARLDLAREQILTHRRSVGALDERLPPGPASLRLAAWAALQDSMPRAAVLSIHARVHGTEPSTWEDPSLVQLWGPRYSAYVVAAPDLAAFSLGRLPDGGEGRRRADDLAGRLYAFLDG